MKKFDGLIDTTPLKDLVKDDLIKDNIRNSPIDLSACTINLADGKAVYGKNKDTQILEYIIASTVIPIMMPTHVIQHVPYVDGGVREVAPLKQALDEGAREVVCILCQPEILGTESINHGNLLEFSDRLMEIVTNELVNNDLKVFRKTKELLENNIRVGHLKDKQIANLITIRPDKPLAIDLEKFTPQDIEDQIELGREAAKKKLAQEKPGWYQPPPS